MTLLASWSETYFFIHSLTHCGIHLIACKMAKKKDTAPAKEGSGSGGQSTEMASMRTMMAALAVRTHPSATFP